MDEMEFTEDTTGLYRLYGKENILLYAGIAYDPPRRVAWHAANQPWGGEITRRTVVWYPDRDEAAKAETDAIATEKPLHNKIKRTSPATPGTVAVYNAWTPDLQRRYDAGETVWIPGFGGRRGYRKATAENFADRAR